MKDQSNQSPPHPGIPIQETALVCGTRIGLDGQILAPLRVNQVSTPCPSARRPHL